MHKHQWTMAAALGVPLLAFASSHDLASHSKRGKWQGERVAPKL